MEFTIEHSHTKRKIKGAFNIYGKRDDLKWLADRLYEQINRSESFRCGWIQIVDPAVTQKHIENTPSSGWDES